MSSNRRKGAAQRHNLKAMLKHLPAPDILNLGLDTASRPPVEAKTAIGFTNRYKLFPDTIDGLIAQLGVHGEAAAIDALWSAVSVWLMQGADTEELSNPSAVANLAVKLCRDYDRVRLGLPMYSPSSSMMALDDLSDEVRQETLRVAAETIADRLRAGKLVVTADRIKCTYQTITAIIHYKAEALA